MTSKTKALTPNSDGEALAALLADPGAVTYFPLARQLRDQQNHAAVKGLKMDGEAATANTVTNNGSYYLRRTLNVFTKGQPDAVSQSFIDFMLSSNGQKIISQAGFIPLNQL